MPATAWDRHLQSFYDGLTAGLGGDESTRDPVEWCERRLGVKLWSKQREILWSVAENRKTAVQSAHEVGKSFVASCAAAWWIESHAPGEAFVVTTAPTGRQVKVVLWREINRRHAAGKLRGRCNQTEWYATGKEGNEEQVAFGQKPADMDPSAFQGIHAPAVLVIMDEACGIPASLYEPADSLCANDDSRMLAIGNPDIPESEFHKACKPGSGWKNVVISAFDSPNFTGEPVSDLVRRSLIGRTYVEERKRKWGVKHPFYVAKVLGQFPEISVNGLIPITWIKAAQERELPAGKPVELGVDVGGGGDKTSVYVRRGPVLRRQQPPNINPDTMQTCGLVVQAIEDEGATACKVDEIGIGRGVVDRARELGVEEVIGVNVGRTAEGAEGKEEYVNLRAQGYWEFRERFAEGNIDIDPDDEDLAAQLVAIRFKRGSQGRIQIESKEDMAKRGMPSPDDADAAMLSFIDANTWSPVW